MATPVQTTFPWGEEKAAKIATDKIALPAKGTCTPQEAVASLCGAVSLRQLRYWIEDGTLLAINSAREPISGKKKRKGRRDNWRIVVRRSELFPKDKYPVSTLEELVPSIANVPPEQ
jgi:hypothetical protein